jgi:transcriptional regulator with XRE-family HTH domain
MVKFMDSHDRDLHEVAPHEEPLNVDMVVGPGETSDNVRFGRMLAELREHAELTRMDAAAALGVSAEYLRLIELGRRTPALGQMRSFLDAYQADGAVGSLQPAGDRQDLIFLPPCSDEPVTVKFKSRIREAGRNAVSSAPEEASRQKNLDQESVTAHPSTSHAAALGVVVSLLARADETTLLRVRDMLQNEGAGDSDANA